MIARLQELISRVNAFLHHRTLDRDFQEELESHLAMLVEDYVGRGMSPEEALRQARLELGERARLAEAHRAARGLPLIDMILRDMEHVLRALRRKPGLALAAILFGVFCVRRHGTPHMRAAVILLSVAALIRYVASRRARVRHQIAYL